MKKTSSLLVAIAASTLLVGTSSSFGAPINAITYSQLGGTNFQVSSATLPTELEDVNLAAATVPGQELNTMTFGYGVLPGAAAQTAVVFVNFYDTFNPASTGSVVSDYIGGFSGTLTVAGNTGTTAALRSTQFLNLTTLTTPIIFRDNSFAVVITYANADGTTYSTTLSPLTNSNAPTVGTSTPGIYRDANSDGIFQATELNATLGNAYLAINTIAAVPEPSTWAMMGLGLGAGAVVIRRRRQLAA